MRYTITLIMTALLLVSCNSVKRNQKFLATGNYDQVIFLAIKKLKKGKNSSKNDAHMQLLGEAFKKAFSEDQRRIQFLKKEGVPSNSKEIYYRYLDLEQRQDLLRPLLPLVTSQGKTINIKIKDYNEELVDAKQNYIAHLYNEGNIYLDRNTIQDARTAYHIFCEIDRLQSNYKDVSQLKDQSHLEGTDFVIVELNNRSGQIIPRPLERDLLDFNTYNLDDFWTQYHERRDPSTNYNFGIRLNFREISVLPERISEREYTREKQILDGWRYKLDRNGNVMKDSLGNDIKIKAYKIVTARVLYTTQTKSVAVGGDVLYKDLVQNRDMDRHPLVSEFIFENEFAKFRGDERALTAEDLEFLAYDFIPFPSNEQMVLDAGEDIKQRLSSILQNNRLR